MDRRNWIAVGGLLCWLALGFFGPIAFDLWLVDHWGPDYTESWAVALLTVRHPFGVMGFVFAAGMVAGGLLVHFFDFRQPRPGGPAVPTAANANTLGNLIKFYASHTAGFALLAKAALDAINGQYGLAVTELMGALGAFGVNVYPSGPPPPAASVVTTYLHPDLRVADVGDAPKPGA
jgi:hypothetical protein